MSSTEQETGVAAAVEAAVRAVDGVTALYRPGSLASNVLAAGAELIGLGRETPFVVVDGDEAPVVRLSIGVRHDAGAADVARRVRDAVLDVLGGHGFAGGSVHLTVSHVSERPASAGGDGRSLRE